MNQFNSSSVYILLEKKMLLSAEILIALLVGYTAAAPFEENFRESLQFAAEFYGAVKGANPNENVIVSPLSVKTALGLLSVGANGKTATEIFDGLHLSQYSRSNIGPYFRKLRERYDGTSMVIANNIFTKVGYSLKPSFNDIAQQSFKSAAQTLDFTDSSKAADVINSWVKENTNGKIEKLFEPDAFDDRTRLVLANAVHFKDVWKTQFDKAYTKKAPFWLNDKEAVEVDMMFNRLKVKSVRSDELQADIVLLPYGNSDLFMLLVVPFSRTGLSKVEAKLPLFDYSSLVDRKEKEVHLFLPRFKIESSVDLKDVFQKLGMGTMFSDKADFSNLLDSDESLEVSKGVHKAYINVDEEGTEAAGSTGFQINTKMVPLPPPVIRADRPFFFAIVGLYDVPFIGAVRKF